MKLHADNLLWMKGEKTMAFNAIIVAEIGDQDSPFAYAITDGDGSLVPEQHDHGLHKALTASSIEVKKLLPGSNDYIRVLYGTDIKVDFYITDSRVAFLCEKYDKGGGWYGGGLSSVILNTGSKIMAAQRRKGKVLIGHIRYEWISNIGYQRKYNFLSTETIRIFYTDTDKITWFVELTWKQGPDAEHIANDLLSKVSKYRLEMTDTKDDKEIEFFTKYSRGGRITPSDDPKRKLSIIRMVNHYYAPKGGDLRPKW